MPPTRTAQKKLQLDRIQAAITPLVGLPQFADFMEIVRDLKDEAVAASVSFETVASERNSLVAKGEVMAWINLLAIYESQKEQFDRMQEEHVAPPPAD
jgi:hypothetical protein